MIMQAGNGISVACRINTIATLTHS